MPLFLLTLADVDNLSDRVSADMQLFLNLLNADGNQPLSLMARRSLRINVNLNFN